jgi:hypothetical protein
MLSGHTFCWDMAGEERYGNLGNSAVSARVHDNTLWGGNQASYRQHFDRFPSGTTEQPHFSGGEFGNGSNGGGRLSMPERPADVLWYTNMLSWPTTLGRNDLRCTTSGSQGLCAPNSRVVASMRERIMCSFQLLHTASETRNGSLSHDHGTFGNTKVGRRQRLVHYINAETAPTTTMEHVHPSAYTCPPSTASSSPSPSSSLSHSHFSPGHALSGTHLLPVLP